MTVVGTGQHQVGSSDAEAIEKKVEQGKKECGQLFGEWMKGRKSGGEQEKERESWL